MWLKTQDQWLKTQDQECDQVLGLAPRYTCCYCMIHEGPKAVPRSLHLCCISEPEGNPKSKPNPKPKSKPKPDSTFDALASARRTARSYMQNWG